MNPHDTVDRPHGGLEALVAAANAHNHAMESPDTRSGSDIVSGPQYPLLLHTSPCWQLLSPCVLFASRADVMQLVAFHQPHGTSPRHHSPK